MPKTSNEKREYQNVSFKEFLKISIWAVKFIFHLNPKYVTIYTVASTLNSLQAIANAYVMAKILDKVIELAQKENANVPDVYPYIGVLFTFNLVLTIFRFIHNSSSTLVRVTTLHKINKALYTKLHSLGIQTLEDPDINNRIHRTNQEIHGLQGYFRQVISMFSRTIELTTTTILVAGFAPILLPVIAVTSVPAILVDKKYRRLIWKFSYENTEGMRKTNANRNDLVHPPSLQEIYINKAFGFLDSKFTTFRNWYAKARTKLLITWNAKTGALGLLNDIGVYFGYLIVFSGLLLQKITVGTTTFQVGMINRLSRSLDNVMASITNALEFTVRIKDVYLLFHEKPAFQDGSIKLKPLTQGPDIKIKNVTFTYPKAEKPTLQRINLSIKSGEKIAIVGHNGSGKTTLVRLLCRMYQPEKGEILINNHNLNDLQLDSWYQNLGVLFQDFNTYRQLTVKENIYIGNPSKRIDKNKIIEAAKSADAYDFINEYPKKFDQILDQKYTGGVRPSTGQWQKLAIARFFYRNAPFVIFDEPTAAIDAISEYNIFNKIYSFFKGKTVIIISHRFSTVRNADRIVVVGKGRIIEEGSHQELMEKNGYYARSFNLQAEGYSD